MDSKQRVDVFINVHKGLRRGLLGLALKIGQVDWNNAADVKPLEDEFAIMLHFLREHSTNEDEIQFDLLEKKAPGAATMGREDHRLLEEELNQLVKTWEKVGPSPDQEKAGYVFYLAFNRFLSRYLAHMDQEETEMTGAFYQHFTDEEIVTGFQKIIARTTPNDMAMMLGYMIPAMNGTERFTFLSNLKLTAPPEIFGKVKGLAQKVLAPHDWEMLSARLG